MTAWLGIIQSVVKQTVQTAATRRATEAALSTCTRNFIAALNRSATCHSPQLLAFSLQLLSYSDLPFLRVHLLRRLRIPISPHSEAAAAAARSQPWPTRSPSTNSSSTTASLLSLPNGRPTSAREITSLVMPTPSPSSWASRMKPRTSTRPVLFNSGFWATSFLQPSSSLPSNPSTLSRPRRKVRKSETR